MQETQVWSLGQEDPIEKEMATHSNILAWETHGQRSLVGYSPWGWKRHNWATKQQPAMEEPRLCLRERKILLPPSPPFLCPVWKQGCCPKKRKKKASLIYISYHWSTNVMRCMEERRLGAGWVTEEEEGKVWAERERVWSDYRTFKMNDSYREW